MQISKSGRLMMLLVVRIMMRMESQMKAMGGLSVNVVRVVRRLIVVYVGIMKRKITTFS